MNNNNRPCYSPPPQYTRSSHYPKKSDEKHRSELFLKHGTHIASPPLNKSLPSIKVFEDDSIESNITEKKSDPPNIKKMYSPDSFPNEKDLKRKKERKEKKGEQNTSFEQSSSKKARSAFSSPQSPRKPRTSIDTYEANKEFILSRFYGVDEKITLHQLEVLLHYFSIIDININEKPLVARNILQLCEIPNSSDEQLYKSHKLMEALIQSYKKASTSSFWKDISNCITSARMNGSRSFNRMPFSPPKLQPSRDSFSTSSKKEESDGIPSYQKYLNKRNKERQLAQTKKDMINQNQENPNMNKKFSKTQPVQRPNFSDIEVYNYDTNEYDEEMTFTDLVNQMKDEVFSERQFKRLLNENTSSENENLKQLNDNGSSASGPQFFERLKVIEKYENYREFPTQKISMPIEKVDDEGEMEDNENEGKNSRNKSKLTATDRQIDSLSKEVDELRAQNDQLTNANKKLQTKNSQLATNYKHLKSSNLVLTFSNRQLKTDSDQLAKLTKELEQLKNDKLLLEYDYSKLKRKNFKLSANNKKLKTDNVFLSTTNKELKQTTNYEKTVILTEQIEKLTEQNNQLLNDNSKLKTENCELETKNSQLESKSDNLRELQNQINELKKQNNRLRAVNRQYEIINNELSSDNVQILSLTEQLNQLKAENEQLLNDNLMLKTANRNLLKMENDQGPNKLSKSGEENSNLFDSLVEEEESIENENDLSNHQKEELIEAV